ncbi:hypothetical protein GOP47_0030451 [Adiantum capillus-veneris]|nr:hypothetical protein GOP47_0030451 [Adiantum capillus-veneris]
MACRELEYYTPFREPSQRSENRDVKRGPGSSNFKLTQVREPLWMGSPPQNRTWVREDLRRTDFTQNDNDGKLSTCGASLNRTALLALIKSCVKQKDLLQGSNIHAHVLEKGMLKGDVPLGNALLSMYAKCDSIEKAQEIFDMLPTRNIVTWNALITGYTQQGLGTEALKCYDRMRAEGLSPNEVTFLCILKACGSIRATEKGEAIHEEINKQGILEKNILVGTTLVDMYLKCGELAKARALFCKLPQRDVILWNAIIAGYAQHGLGYEALSCLEQMQNEGHSPSIVTYICILKACGSVRAIEKGEQIHAEVNKQGLLEKDSVLGTALVDMYAKCGVLSKAQEVFDKLPKHSLETWTALIDGYAEHGQGHEALRCFETMQGKNFSPDSVIFGSVLKACGSIREPQKGEEIHAEIRRYGLLEKDVVLGNSLVDMYAKCGAFAKAEILVDELPLPNVVRWNSLLTGYAQEGLGNEAISCFARMQDKGFSPDLVTFISILKACGSIGAIEKGLEIHAEIDKQGLLEKDNVLGTVLVDMYMKCGVLSKAQRVFGCLPVKSVATWTVLICGYAQHGHAELALSWFQKMRDEGFSPNAVTFIGLFKACGILGAVEKGKAMHAQVRRQRFLEQSKALGTALVDMYVKCGALRDAKKAFDELPVQDVATRTAIIAGYAQVGRMERVFDLFLKMTGEGVEPNGVTFLVLLSACSHAGLVEEGQIYFDTMSTAYGIFPTVEHRICMIDMFCRAGNFNKAVGIIEVAPASDHVYLCLAMMGACRTWGNLQLGSWAFNKAVKSGEGYAAAYVCMSDLYAAAGMEDE